MELRQAVVRSVEYSVDNIHSEPYTADRYLVASTVRICLQRRAHSESCIHSFVRLVSFDVDTLKNVIVGYLG